MNKTQKKQYKQFQQDMNRKDDESIQKIEQKIKDKTVLKKCETFCQKKYIPKINKMSRKQTGKLPSREGQQYHWNYCKRMYCNPTCLGIKSSKIHKGFYKKYTKRKKEWLTKKGALSGCEENQTIIPK